jgi:hypothetical protein
MGHFTLRLVDLGGNIAQVYDQEYRDALDALDAAKRLSSQGTIEVWTQTARIARVNKGNRPSGPEDRISG